MSILRDILIAYRVAPSTVTEDQVEELAASYPLSQNVRAHWVSLWENHGRLDGESANSAQMQWIRREGRKMFPPAPAVLPQEPIQPVPEGTGGGNIPETGTVASEAGVKGTESPTDLKRSEGSELSQPPAETIRVVGPLSEPKTPSEESLQDEYQEEPKERGLTRQIRLRLLPTVAKALMMYKPKARAEIAAAIIEERFARWDLEGLIEARKELHRIGVNVNQALAIWQATKSPDHERKLREELGILLRIIKRFLGEG